MGRLATWAIVGSVAVAACTARAQAPSTRLPRNVDPETVQMIDRGLEYLKNTQRPDGSWTGGAHGQSYPAVMTALAGLALLSNGSTPLEGKYSENVRKAMNFLLECAEKTRFTKDGVKMCVISSETGAEMRSMYGHGFGMLFLAECFGCELDPKTSRRLRAVLEESGALISSSQSALGGWYYTPHSGADEGSVTVTQMQCLRAARNAGVKVNKGTIEKAAQYLEKSQVRESDGTISIAYQARGAGAGGGRPPLVGAAVCVLYSGGRYDSEIAKGCLEYVKRRWSNDQLFQGHYFYAHFYMAQALYQVGGKDWDAYYVKMRDKFKGMQAADGSWNGDYVGQIYGTAIATMILQMPYNYLPIFAR